MSSTTTVGAADADAQASLGMLYQIVLREVEDETALSEIDPDLYRNASKFIGNLGRQEYAGVESAVKGRAMETASELVSLLLQTRLEKAAKIGASQDGEGAASIMQRLLDEEKFILDSDEERDERRDIILSAARSGRSKLLEAVSESHKTGRVVVRFLKDVGQMVGADMELYGPFKAEDVATVPRENAQALVSENAAVRVRWEDYGGRRQRQQ